MPKAKIIKIKGGLVSVYVDCKGKMILQRRKIVEPEWVSLWFKIQDGGWDDGEWLRLNDVDRNFLSFCVYGSHIDNPKFTTALAKDQRIHFDTLKRIEGELLAGNVNKQMVDDYNRIIDSLVASLQMSRRQGTLMKNRMERTYAAMVKSN